MRGYSLAIYPLMGTEAVDLTESRPRTSPEDSLYSIWEASAPS